VERPTRDYLSSLLQAFVNKSYLHASYADAKKLECLSFAFFLQKIAEKIWKNATLIHCNIWRV
jgi:hypothetical protein